MSIMSLLTNNFSSRVIKSSARNNIQYDLLLLTHPTLCSVDFSIHPSFLHPFVSYYSFPHVSSSLMQFLSARDRHRERRLTRIPN